MDDRRIEKETRTVEFELSDGGRLTGEVFVGQFDSHHTGPQRVGELLGGESGFLPVRASDGVHLLNTRLIVLARISATVERDELMTLGEKRFVRLRLAQSRELTGDIYVAVESGNRVSDFFGQSLRFFPLFQNDEITYVNRDFLLDVQD